MGSNRRLQRSSQSWRESRWSRLSNRDQSSSRVLDSKTKPQPHQLQVCPAFMSGRFPAERLWHGSGSGADQRGKASHIKVLWSRDASEGNHGAASRTRGWSMMGQAKQMFLTALKIQMDYHNHTWVLPPRLHKKKLSLSAQGMSQHHTASKCLKPDAVGTPVSVPLPSLSAISHWSCGLFVAIYHGTSKWEGAQNGHIATNRVAITSAEHFTIYKVSSHIWPPCPYTVWGGQTLYHPSHILDEDVGFETAFLGLVSSCRGWLGCFLAGMGLTLLVCSVGLAGNGQLGARGQDYGWKWPGTWSAWEARASEERAWSQSLGRLSGEFSIVKCM